MRLQVALDEPNIETAIQMMYQMFQHVDIIEIGTPMILNNGLEPVKTIKKLFPDMTVLADTKIVDAGELEAKLAFQAGADIVTVMGFTNIETVQRVISTAKAFRKCVMVDMMCVEAVSSKALEFVQMGADFVCEHLAADVQGKGEPLSKMMDLIKSVGAEHCAVAGGLNYSNIRNIVPFQPAIVIVGKGITGESDVGKAAKSIHDAIYEANAI